MQRFFCTKTDWNNTSVAEYPSIVREPVWTNLPIDEEQRWQIINGVGLKYGRVLGKRRYWKLNENRISIPACNQSNSY